MAFDYTPYQALILWAVGEYGESITFNRLTVDYSTIPPAETWTLIGTINAIVQPSMGFLNRADPGFAQKSTHRIVATHDSGILAGDRIYRTGDTNYYLVNRVENWSVMFEVWVEYVAGAV